MEIERKFLISKEKIPANIEQYPHSRLEQAYLITDPVLRIRQDGEAYILTYKGPGFLQREEVEFPLKKEAYERLLSKADGNIITKFRYRIPDSMGHTIELDCFLGPFEGLYLAEVEFSDLESANAYLPPEWFGAEVTSISTYHNSVLSKLSQEEIIKLVSNDEYKLDS